MKFRILSNALQLAVTQVNRGVSTKPPLPVLEGIKITTLDNTLRFEATDLKLGVRIEQASEIDEPGTIVLPAKLLYEISRKLPAGEATICVEGTSATITCCDSRFLVHAFAAEDFPAVVPPTQEDVFHMTGADLKEMIAKVAFGAAPDASRPMLDGILWEASGPDQRLTAVTLDGDRLARIYGLPYSGGQRFVLPARDMQQLDFLLPDEGLVTITVGDSMVSFQADGVTVVMTRLAGNFTKWEPLIPASYTTLFTCQKEALQQALDRTALVARTGMTHQVQFHVSEKSLVLLSQGPAGESREELPIAMEGNEMDIFFNVRLLLEMLRAISDERIKVALNTNLSPGTFLPDGHGDWVYLLMPLRAR